MTLALDSYNKAIRVAQTNEEKAMISKNLGTAHSKLIQKFVASSASDSRGNILDNLELTTVYFKDALELDQGGKAYSLKAEQRLEHSKTAFNCQFKRAVELQEAGGKKHFLAASLLEDNYAFEEAFKIYKKHDRKEMEDLKDSIRFHHCLSRVEILFTVAEDMKREALFESEEINMLMVWPTVDKYREALLFSDGVCLEKEARIHGHLGRFYDDVLKDIYRAKDHYRQSIFLAQTLKPATIYMQAEWYKHCTKRMQNFQDQAWIRDEEMWQKEREPILKELRSVVDKLMKKSKTMKAEEFVAYLHKEHPPKKKQEVKNKTIKEVLRAALLEYHPDKQKKDLKEDKKWFTRPEAERLCQEMHPQGALAEFETSEEAIAMTIHLNKDYNKCKGLAPPGPWIGGIERSNQNIFDWSSINATIGCTNWELGRPNSSTTGDGIALNCASYYTWFDAANSTELPFVCEIPYQIKCPDNNFTFIGSSCYLISESRTIRSTAIQRCQESNATLLEMETSNEILWMTAYLLTQPRRSYWLPIDPDPVHDLYRWHSTGRHVTYSYWLAGYPKSYNNEQLTILYADRASLPTAAPTNKTATRHHEIFCDPPFLNIFNRGCYVFSYKITKTRQEAQRLCKEMHPEGTLAELETSEEAVALAVYLNEHYSKCDGWALPGPWIGGVERGNQNIFEWPSTNTSIDCSNWEIGQPNSPTSKDGIALDCSKHYTWYDSKVDTVLPFVCESPPRPPSNGTQEGCRFPFTNIEDRYCYYFSGTNRLQRVHAQSYCKTLHPYGRLAEIESGEELVSLTLYLDDQDEQRKCGTWGAPGPWIGGEELGNTSVFTWSSDVELGTPSSLGVMISNWGRGQPNSNTSNDGIALNCTNQYAWFDAQNSTELPFVCEAPYNLAECPENFTFIDGRCYLISESTTHRSTAIQRCQESNATLLELETSSEIRSITDYLLAKCPGSCTRHYHLGMDPDPVHRVYKWISTGRPVTFNNWLSGYPNNYSNGQLALLNAGYNCKYRLYSLHRGYYY
ncbi:unnamed protein product, partial [Cyprideis torosa]